MHQLLEIVFLKTEDGLWHASLVDLCDVEAGVGSSPAWALVDLTVKNPDIETALQKQAEIRDTGLVVTEQFDERTGTYVPVAGGKEG